MFIIKSSSWICYAIEASNFECTFLRKYVDTTFVFILSYVEPDILSHFSFDDAMQWAHAFSLFAFDQAIELLCI